MKPTRPKYDLKFLYTSFPERDKVEWYKWEFLRRNSEYKADYKKFEDSFGAWLRQKGYWYDYNKRPKWSKSDEKYFYAVIAPVIVRLCLKWRVGDLHPPQRRFKKMHQWKFREERPSGPATGFPPEFVCSVDQFGTDRNVFVGCESVGMEDRGVVYQYAARRNLQCLRRNVAHPNGTETSG